MTAHALSGSGEAHMLLRRGLYADGRNLYTEILRNVSPHLLDMRSELRPLSDHGHVAVFNSKAGLQHASNRFA